MIVKKEQKSRKELQPEGHRITTTLQHENRFEQPQVKA